MHWGEAAFAPDGNLQLYGTSGGSRSFDDVMRDLTTCYLNAPRIWCWKTPMREAGEYRISPERAKSGPALRTIARDHLGCSALPEAVRRLEGLAVRANGQDLELGDLPAADARARKAIFEGLAS